MGVPILIRRCLYWIRAMSDHCTCSDVWCLALYPLGLTAHQLGLLGHPDIAGKILRLHFCPIQAIINVWSSLHLMFGGRRGQESWVVPLEWWVCISIVIMNSTFWGETKLRMPLVNGHQSDFLIWRAKHRNSNFKCCCFIHKTSSVSKEAVKEMHVTSCNERSLFSHHLGLDTSITRFGSLIWQDWCLRDKWINECIISRESHVCDIYVSHPLYVHFYGWIQWAGVYQSSSVLLLARDHGLCTWTGEALVS